MKSECPKSRSQALPSLPALGHSIRGGLELSWDQSLCLFYFYLSSHQGDKTQERISYLAVFGLLKPSFLLGVCDWKHPQGSFTGLHVRGVSMEGHRRNEKGHWLPGRVGTWGMGSEGDFSAVGPFIHLKL